MHEYVIPRSKMDLFRRTRSDRVHPLSSTVTVSLNTYTPWQWPSNDEMQLHVCRPYVYGRDNPALVRWTLSNKLKYAEAFRQQQIRDERIERTALTRGMDSNVLKFVESRSRGGEDTPLGVLREGLMEVVFGMGDRLYVVYPRYLSMRDVEFIYRTSERIVVAAVRQSGDCLLYTSPSPRD